MSTYLRLSEVAPTITSCSRSPVCTERYRVVGASEEVWIHSRRTMLAAGARGKHLDRLVHAFERLRGALIVAQARR